MGKEHSSFKLTVENVKKKRYFREFSYPSVTLNIIMTKKDVLMLIQWKMF